MADTPTDLLAVAGRLIELAEKLRSTRLERLNEMERRYDGPMPESARKYIETGEW